MLVNLIASTEAHFKHEERIMHAAHYASLAWHKKQHDAVRWRVRWLGPSGRVYTGPAIGAN